MLRKISFCSAFALLIGLTGLAAAQNVTVQLTPISYPIVLPDSGGSFDYLLFVTNQDSAPITATVWCTITLPDGSLWGPVAGPSSQTLAAGQTLGYYRTQAVPPRAPFGYYMFHAYVGIYPDTVWAQAQFELQRQGISGTEQQWVARYNGPANDHDEACAIATDGGANVFVTGRSGIHPIYYDYLTIKYDADGNQIWVARYNGPENGSDYAYGIAADGDGNVHVTGYSSGCYATIKYNSLGAEQWVARYNGGNGGDYATAIAMDQGGNVYVTGASQGSGTLEDYATIKYNSAGVRQWVARYNGPGNGADRARAVTLDGSGNVYVTGESYAIGIWWDYATVKYDSMGAEQWVARYNGPANYWDMAKAIAVDGSGHVYATGYSGGIGTGPDYATIEYNSAGMELWVARYNWGNGGDYANAIAVDQGGNVYVTGYSQGIETGYDYATIKYDSTGVEQWVARYNGPGNYYDDARSITIDRDGNVYVAGVSNGNGTLHDYATIKYNSEGVVEWVARYNGPGNGDDDACSIAIDGSENVYVTGTSHGSETSDDYATIKYAGGNIANWMPVEETVLGQPLPQECRLEGNFPNPFNASTVLSFELRVPSFVSLKVYDTAGRLVATLVDGWRAAGTHELTWNASHLPSGMYFARMKAGDYVVVQKIILLK